jgi:hypothetical protein
MRHRAMIALYTTVIGMVTLLLICVSAVNAMPVDRGYELVTPPDTGPYQPNAASLGSSDGFDCFETYLATPDGEGVIFTNGSPPEGGASNGILNLYEARRTPTGWMSASKSATGAQSTYPGGGLCTSPDHQFSSFLTGSSLFEQGTLGQEASYLRTPEGAFVLAGVGSIGTDPKANIKWIADGAAHVILTSRKRLEPEAPIGVGSGGSPELSAPAVNAVYDRTSAGLHVVSLLPSGSAPDSTSETTFYRGASADGSGVVFEVVSEGGSTLYEHRSGQQTVPIATGLNSGDNRFAAISSDGSTVTFMKIGPANTNFPVRGSIYSFDADTQATVPVSEGSEAAIVNVSDDGSHVYFSSEQALAGVGPNVLGDSPSPGGANLYAWDNETEDTRFVATVAAADVEGNPSVAEDLVEWMRTVARAQQDRTAGRVNAVSRTTPDGTVFVFQAHGSATDYDSGAHSEIYRYDSRNGDLACISCPKGTSAPAASSAYLAKDVAGSFMAFNSLARLPNVTDDGERVFFTTAEPLVAADTNGVLDVYGWEAGQIALISTGEGVRPSLLYAMSRDGRDVFFLTAEQLVPQDTSTVASIYDAREGSNGFPLPPPGSSEGTLQSVPPPLEPAGGTETLSAAPDPRPYRPKLCRRKQLKKKHCPRKHHRHNHHRRHRGGTR